MDIAGKARKIERRLARTVDAAIGELVGRDEPAPLEILHAVLDRAEQEVQEIGRGRRVFPYNCVRVHVVAGPDDRGARARFDAVIAGPPSLADRLAERLRLAGCSEVQAVTEIIYTPQAGDGWDDPRFHVVFDRLVETTPQALPPPPAEPAQTPRLKLTVVKGSADQRAYAFSGGRIDVGRRAEVIDQKHRLIRTNQVAFSEEGADENRTVSRRHAHIEFVEREGRYRIWDDRSTHGTSILRGGKTIKVAAGAKGTRLEAGDEIALGHARLKVTLETGRRG